MRLRIKTLLLRISTAEGLYGAKLDLKPGLCIIRAGNTKGKSTCVQSILYGLGLEGMLSARHEVPLAPAVTDSIEVEENRWLKVLASEVLLEVENYRGETITIRRPIAGQEDIKLVSVWEGAALSKGTSSLERRDYFVRVTGGATRQAGFHKRLAEFVGWELPEVPSFTGKLVPLYMEAVMPLMFVEQKRGWGGTHPRFPGQFGIREVGRRAVEFLLDLDVYDLEVERDVVKEKLGLVKSEWSEAIAKHNALASALNGAFRDVPNSPVASWPPAIAPHAIIAISGKWFSLDEARDSAEAELSELEGDLIPRVNQVVRATEDALTQEEEKLGALELGIGRLLEELEIDKGQLEEIDERREALEEDLRRNQDSLRLQKLGSAQDFEFLKNRCPSCHQPLRDSLLPQDIARQPMSLEDNIVFLKEQRRITQFMREEASRVISEKERQLSAFRQAASESRSRIRTLKETLVSRGEAPSLAAVERKFRLRERLDKIERLKNLAVELFDRLEELSSKWREVEEARAQAPSEGLSKDDSAKLAKLEESVREQLRFYRFSSREPEELEISRGSYQLVHEGFDLQFESSASDVVRALWAYLLGLLETARGWPTNHLGLLIADEPRQQNMAHESMVEFLRRASAAGQFGQQVIVTISSDTISVDDELLENELKDAPHTLLAFEGKILKKLAG